MSVAPAPACGKARLSVFGPATSATDVELIARWLRHLVAPGQVTELVALGRERGGRHGFYDHDHLGEMARTAAELSDSGLFKGIYFRFNPVKPALLPRCPNRVEQLRKGGAATDADILSRRLLLIDADPQRPGDCPATDGEKAKAKARIFEVRDYLRGEGWPEPVLADSGNGFHLLYRNDLPADDGGLVRGVLHALAERFNDGGVGIDTKVFNPARLTKVYGTLSAKGDHTAERPHRRTALLETPGELKAVPKELLEKLGRQAKTSLAASVGRLVSDTGAEAAAAAASVPVSEKLIRAKAYLAKLPPAVEGKGGDNQTFTAACLLVKDFALSVEEALPLLRGYNERCVPPWPEAELVRKLEYAARLPGERGRLLRHPGRDGGPGPAPERGTAPAVADAPPFPVAVPDFMTWDLEAARPKAPLATQDRKGRPGRRRVMSLDWLWDVIRFAVVRSQRLPVVVPDLFLGCLLWDPWQAGDWPANWRRTLQAALPAPPRPAHPEGMSKEEKARQTRAARKGHRAGQPRDCGEFCPLHGTAAPPHRHFRWTADEGQLGALFRFVTGRTGGEVRFDFRNRLTEEEAPARKAELKGDIKERKAFLDEYCDRYPKKAKEAKAELREVIAEYKRLRPGQRKVRGVRAVYLPVRVFGPSPLSGLTAAQCNVLKALTLELTRTSVPNGRADKAQVVSRGSGRKHPREKPVPVCPLLGEGDWVMFNGTGTPGRRKLHGNGFRVATWLTKAGYPEGSEYSIILRDLKHLAGPFGLVVAGWNGKTLEWKSLDDMLALCGTPCGRKWLEQCVLRAYTKADYLARWRQYFAERLGFSSIPGGGGEGPAARAGAKGGPAGIRTANDLQAFVKRHRLTDGKLAELLGVHRVTVTHYRAGRRRWRRPFQEKLDALAARLEA